MKLILSAQASQQLQDLYDYLEKSWSPSVRRKFQKRLDRCISAIKLFPKGFPESSIFHGCRKCVVTSRTSLYHRFKEDVIEIVSVSDNRQQL